MRGSAINAKQLLEVSGRLGDAAIDPTIWPDILHQISKATSAIGAALLQGDVRTPDIPRSPGVNEGFNDYLAHGWHTRDERGERCVPRLMAGEKVIIDQDIFTPEEMRRSAFYDFLASHDLRWFAVLGFSSGAAHWALAIQRTRREGPFQASDKVALARLNQRLTEAATLSRAVGRTVLSGVVNALGLVNKPALALGRMGFVLGGNAQAERFFDNDFRVHNRRIVVRDQRARAALDTLIDQLRNTPDTAALPAGPFVVSRHAKHPLMIRVLPIPGAASTPFLGARALLVLTDLSPMPGAQPVELAHLFGLTRAEAKLAAIIATGCSPEQAAEKLGIARETARNQLKAVFAKTGTHRQGELIALLSRL
jgi:DNA-binding CsgD family transcriptional regulator